MRKIVVCPFRSFGHRGQTPCRLECRSASIAVVDLRKVRYKWPFVRCSFKGLYSLHFGSSSTSDLTPSSEDQIWWFDWRHGNPDFDAKRAGIRSPIGPATDTGAQN